MNLNTYSNHYSKFHKCTISSIENGIIVFDFGCSPYETFMVSRMYPAKMISTDSNKPLLSALKSFCKTDATASVICNDRYLWTICLGKEQMIYPVSAEMNPSKKLRLYATPYFVTNPQIISQYLQGKAHPAYGNVYYYESTILYLDNEDLPYPGGFYFDACEPTNFYRICLLSDEPFEYVFRLAKEWQSRRNILTIPFITSDVTALPKFIDFKPVSDFMFSESNIISLGAIERKLSSKKPEHLIQDILISYYRNVSRKINISDDFTSLGLIIEWPFILTFEGARTRSHDNNADRKNVALCINGNNPNKVLYVSHPYDRYVEYSHVPATIWTPISFVYTTLMTDLEIKKVELDTVCIGLVYREIFFCFGQPLFEGMPSDKPFINTNYILSVNNELPKDSNIRVLESFKYNENYSLNRVSLRGLALETWCLTKSESTHPFPKRMRLPYLVTEWLDFVEKIGSNVFDIDVSTVRLALTLSKHNICYNLIAEDNVTTAIDLNNDEIKFYVNEKVMNFINNARIAKNIPGSACVIL